MPSYNFHFKCPDDNTEWDHEKTVESVHELERHRLFLYRPDHPGAVEISWLKCATCNRNDGLVITENEVP